MRIRAGFAGVGGSGYSPIGASFDAWYARSLFADGGIPSTFSAMHTIARLSTKYAQDSAGNYTSFGNNVPAITDLGILIEESRTNSIRNNSMQGAVAGTPGTNPINWSSAVTSAGLVKTIVGIGSENGLDYIDYRWAGVVNTAATSVLIDFEINTQIAATIGQVWTNSIFHKLVGGTLANVVDLGVVIFERDAGGAALVAGNANFTPTALIGRAPYTRTLVNASTAYVLSRLQGTFTNAAAVDFTLRIYLPQLELGAFATSPIRTTGSAATRAADVITSPVRFASFTQGSYCIEWGELIGPVSTERRLLVLADGTAANFIRARLSNANFVTSDVSSATVLVSALTSTSAIVANTNYKTASRWGLNDFAAAFSPSLRANIDTDIVGAIPAGPPTLLSIGYNGVSSTGQINGFLKRITLYPRKLTDAELGVLVA